MDREQEELARMWDNIKRNRRFALGREELRVTIATSALNGILAAGDHDYGPVQKIAMDAVNYADALLKELES